MKRALITGITGQDGAYLAELLLQKGYQVHGIKRRSSSFNTARIDHIFQDEHEERDRRFILHYGDVTDASNIIRVIQEVQPDEIYHLAAQSHVAVSFETPEYTAQADALGTLRILEAIRILGLTHKVRFYQASTSELYGNTSVCPQNETTAFAPCSPYAVAKLYAYWITVNYRQAYGIFACNGILFNHESPLRGETFVTRKITRAAVRIKYGYQNMLFLGNLDAKRDWGYAKEYVAAMWLMLQQEKPHDLVIATGVMHTVQDFVNYSFDRLGISLVWFGQGKDAYAVDSNTGKKVVCVDQRYMRPTEVQQLCGDASRARNVIGWQPRVTLQELVALMIDADEQLFLSQIQQETLFLKAGRRAYQQKYYEV